MNQETLNTLRAAEDAVGCVVEVCQKDGPLYNESPKSVAHASRTSKWLLNAIAKLREELKTPRNDNTAH